MNNKNKSKKNNNHPIRFALLLTVFCALGPFTLDMYLSSFPQILKFFGTTAAMVQASLTAGLLGLSLGQIVIGTFSDMYGRRRPLLISMIIYFLSSVGCVLAPSIGVFIVLRFVQGFAGSAGLVISRAIARDKFSGLELTKFFALLSTVNSAAPLISPLAGGAIVSYFSWFGVFIFTGFVGIYLTLITLWKIEETLPIEKRIQSNFAEVLNNYKALFSNRTFMGYALSSGLIYAGMFGYIAASPFVFQNIYNVSPQVFSILFAFNGIGIMVGAQVMKQLAGRITEQAILKIGLSLNLIISASVLMVVIFHGPLFSLVASLFLLNLAMGIIGPISFRLAIESQGHIAGTASALLGVLPFLLGSITSPLAGIAGEESAVPFGMIVFVTGLLAIILKIILVSDENEKVSSVDSDII